MDGWSVMRPSRQCELMAAPPGKKQPCATPWRPPILGAYPAKACPGPDPGWSSGSPIRICADRDSQTIAATEPAMQTKQYPVSHTDAEWRKLLTPDQYEVLRGHGTEAPGSCALNY